MDARRAIARPLTGGARHREVTLGEAFNLAVTSRNSLQDTIHGCNGPGLEPARWPEPIGAPGLLDSQRSGSIAALEVHDVFERLAFQKSINVISDDGECSLCIVVRAARHVRCHNHVREVP